jgi:hypothetical protein
LQTQPKIKEGNAGQETNVEDMISKIALLKQKVQDIEQSIKQLSELLNQ